MDVFLCNICNVPISFFDFYSYIFINFVMIILIKYLRSNKLNVEEHKDIIELHELVALGIKSLDKI